MKFIESAGGEVVPVAQDIRIGSELLYCNDLCFCKAILKPLSELISNPRPVSFNATDSEVALAFD